MIPTDSSVRPEVSRSRTNKRKVCTFLLAWAAFIALLTAGACNVLDQFPLPFITPPAQVTATPIAITPTPVIIMAASPTPQLSAPEEIVLWLPPEFDPENGRPHAKILADRLLAFQKETGIAVRIRLKASSGPGSTLESLSAAAAAAPAALPGVTALPRADLEIAALKGLIYPLDGASTLIDNTDWYDYARQLAMVQGVTFGLPFAGDGQVIVYRPARVAVTPNTWDAILRLGQPLAFAAGNPQSLLTISLYRSYGGLIEDAQRRPSLQADQLAKVLAIYQNAAKSAIFLNSFFEYETDQQAWQSYEDGLVNAVITWSSYYLENRPPDGAIQALPAAGENQVTLATGWAWVITDPIPDRRSYSVLLAEWLSDPAFLAAWDEAAGYLPTRPSSLAAWRDPGLRTILGQISLTAEARPSNDLLISLGPVLKEAASQVINQTIQPTDAASRAAERLAVPPSR